MVQGNILERCYQTQERASRFEDGNLVEKCRNLEKKISGGKEAWDVQSGAEELNGIEWSQWYSYPG